MDKRKRLIKKMKTLIKEIESAKSKVDKESEKYLCNYQRHIENLLFEVQNGTLSASKGKTMGVSRAISEFDNLAEIDDLYNAASEVDLYYKKKCIEW